MLAFIDASDRVRWGVDELAKLELEMVIAMRADGPPTRASRVRYVELSCHLEMTRGALVEYYKQQDAALARLEDFDVEIVVRNCVAEIEGFLAQA